MLPTNIGPQYDDYLMARQIRVEQERQQREQQYLQQLQQMQQNQGFGGRMPRRFMEEDMMYGMGMGRDYGGDMDYDYKKSQQDRALKQALEQAINANEKRIKEECLAKRKIERERHEKEWAGKRKALALQRKMKEDVQDKAVKIAKKELQDKDKELVQKAEERKLMEQQQQQKQQPQELMPVIEAAAKNKARIEVSYDHEGKTKALIPLTKSNLECEIIDGHAKMKMHFCFTNNSSKNPVEATLDFPKDEETIITSLTVNIGGKIIEARVEEKEEAKQAYTDAIQKRKVATITTTKKNGKGLTLVLGNLACFASAEVIVHMSKYVEIEGGAYAFRLPVTYFPDYGQNEINPTYVKNRLAEGHKYDFTYQINMTTQRQITWASIPADGKLVEQNQKSISVKNAPKQKIPKTDLMFYYTTDDMVSPNLMYQESKDHPDEVACLTSFVPITGPILNNMQHQFKVVTGEIPDHIVEQKEPYCFTFLVDRSLSMEDGIRMQTTRDALLLFMQSLPANCAFNILCFGGRKFDWMQQEQQGKCFYKYEEYTKKLAQDRIKAFKPDYIGTNILKPLQMAYAQATPGYIKNIFLLTDGEVQNPDEIVQFVQEQSAKPGNRIRTHAFGIGDGCDVDLCERISVAGRGSFSFAEDGTPDLRHLVIKALKKASMPSMENCIMQWNQETRHYNEVFGADLFTSMQIVKKAEFDNLQVTFKCQNDPRTNNPVSVTFNRNNFKQIADGNELFKHAIDQKIKASREPNNKQHVLDAVQYQVLTDQTAMIAIVKEKIKDKGELVQAKIPFGKKIITQKPEAQPQYGANGEMIIDPSEARDAKEANGVSSGDTRGSANVIASMLQNSDYDEVDKILELPEMQAVFEEFEYEPPEDRDQLEELVQQIEMEDDGQVEEFVDKFMDVYNILKFRIENGTYRLKRPPTFHEFVMMQESKGNWPDDSKMKLEALIEGDVENNEIQQKLKGTKNATQVFYTLVALYVLELIWDDLADEWEMIARKAKLWLKSQGINDVTSFTNAMSYKAQKYE